MNFNRYFNNEELSERLQSWADNFVDLVQLEELGRSFEGKTIPLLILTRKGERSHESKPAIWFDANIHATEIAGTTTTLHIAHTLLEGYGRDERITRLLDETTFYIAPRLNPDGAALALADNPKYIRSGSRPYPYPEKAEGIHEEDMDGDGRILQMRIPDPAGDWKVSSLDPRLMQKRDADENDGEFYRLLPEGRIEDYDGILIKGAPPLQGLDFNRNFPFEWQPDSTQRGAGPYPTSEVEIRALVDFFTRHSNINIALTYHTFSGVILRPWSSRPDEKMETNDLWVYEKMGERGKDLTGYPAISVYHGFRYHPKEVTTGAFDDWVYDHLGIYAFTVELWDLVGRAGIKDREFIEWFRKHPHEEDLKILQWLEKHNQGEGVIDWYPYDHPQLGRVELGGYDPMYTWRNPPHHFMQEEAERNTPYALSLAEMLPRLTLPEVSLEPIGDGHFRLRMIVENVGFLPTYTSIQGKNRKATRTVRVELSLPAGVELISGRRKVDLGHLEGRSNKMDVTALGSTSQTDNRAWREWVVRGPEGAEIEVSIEAARAGALVHTITLG